MTTIDGASTGFRTRLDAAATAKLDTIAALGGDETRCGALHRIVDEHHAALQRSTGRSADELERLAVDAEDSAAAAPSPAGAVDGGQGATRPPAPTVDGGGVGSGNAPGPEVDDVPPSAPVEHTPTVPYFGTVALPRPHVHFTDAPCGYGDRCGK